MKDNNEKKPLIVINFKTYDEATAHKAEKLAKIAEMVSKTEKVPIIVAVQPTDIYRISKSVSIPVYAQHIDPVVFGSHTGSILPEAVISSGATGTLINHSEKKLSLDVIEKTIKRAKELKLQTICCVADSDQAKAVAQFNPDYVAVEPPELIGGDISVSTAQPELIADAVKKVKSVSFTTKLLVGAGVKTKEDIDIALKLGAVGVLLASGVTKAKDPKKAIQGLIIDLEKLESEPKQEKQDKPRKKGE
ncbi:MAG: triose-phosphate isomerase [archaeon]